MMSSSTSAYPLLNYGLTPMACYPNYYPTYNNHQSNYLPNPAAHMPPYVPTTPNLLVSHPYELQLQQLMQLQTQQHQHHYNRYHYNSQRQINYSNPVNRTTIPVYYQSAPSAVQNSASNHHQDGHKQFRFSVTKSIQTRTNTCYNFPFSPELLAKSQSLLIDNGLIDHNSAPYCDLLEPDTIEYFRYNSPYNTIVSGNLLIIYERYRGSLINNEKESVFLDQFRTNHCFLPLMSLIFYIEMSERYRLNHVEDCQLNNTKVVVDQDHQQLCSRLKTMIDNIDLNIEKYHCCKLAQTIKVQTDATIERLRNVKEPKTIVNLGGHNNIEQILTNLSHYISIIRHCPSPLSFEYGQKNRSIGNTKTELLIRFEKEDYVDNSQQQQQSSINTRTNNNNNCFYFYLQTFYRFYITLFPRLF